MNTRNFRQSTLLAAIVFCLTSVLWADSITFALLPSDGNVSGPPGSLVGWGYSLTNDSSADWFVSTNLGSDSFSNGTPTNLFDFPNLGPGQNVTEPFDPVNGIGVYELQWDPSAPGGFVNSGKFVLSGEWLDGDPLNGGNFIDAATDTALPYSATVSGSTSGTPEPSSFALFACGVSLLIGFQIARSLRRLYLSPATQAEGGHTRA
jgi:hypothetical protein